MAPPSLSKTMSKTFIIVIRNNYCYIRYEHIITNSKLMIYRKLSEHFTLCKAHGYRFLTSPEVFFLMEHL